MSDSLQPDAPLTGDTEEVDAVVVVPEGQSRAVAASVRTVVPAVQAAAVAATGFVAGAAVVGLAHRRQRRRDLIRAGSRRGLLGGGRGRVASGRGGRGSRGAGELVQIVGSRSLLVDVHLLGGRR